MTGAKNMDILVGQPRRINECNIGATISPVKVDTESLLPLEPEVVKKADAIFKERMKVLHGIWNKKKRELRGKQ